MTLPRLPLIMGMLMGLVMPWMMHMEGGNAGMWFVLAHAAILLPVLLMAVFVPNIWRKVRRVKAHLRHLPYMLGAVAIGWAVKCALCLFLEGQHWT